MDIKGLKIFACDVETTGLDVDKHEIHEISYKIIDNGRVTVSRKLFLRPNNPSDIDPKALSICDGIDEATIMAYPSSDEAFNVIMGDLEEHIDVFDPTDKFYILAYNASFDMRFLRALILSEAKKINADIRFGSFFRWKKNEPALDVYHSLAFYAFVEGIEFENYKLETICKYFGIPLLKAHDSMHDLEATIKLTKKFIKSISRVPESDVKLLDYDEMLDLVETTDDTDESKLETYEKLSETLVARDIA